MAAQDEVSDAVREWAEAMSAYSEYRDRVLKAQEEYKRRAEEAKLWLTPKPQVVEGVGMGEGEDRGRLIGDAVDGEVHCLQCDNRRLNRKDTNCWKCGGMKLDRSQVVPSIQDEIRAKIAQVQAEGRRAMGLPPAPPASPTPPSIAPPTPPRQIADLSAHKWSFHDWVNTVPRLPAGVAIRIFCPVEARVDQALTMRTTVGNPFHLCQCGVKYEAGRRDTWPGSKA